MGAARPKLDHGREQPTINCGENSGDNDYLFYELSATYSDCEDVDYGFCP